jgi:signal transduction histidine kinase
MVEDLQAGDFRSRRLERNTDCEGHHVRLTLEKKVTVLMVGVIVITVLSSVVAVLSSRHVGRLMERTVTENLPSVRAAEELEIAVLEQRGFVSSYLLDGGNRDWLLVLQNRKQNFYKWLRAARKTAHSPEEKEILAKLEDVYRQYDSERDEVVARYDRGEAASAQKLLLNEVNLLYDQAYKLCESFIAANERYVNANVADARRQIDWVSLVVGASVLVTVGLGAMLLWLFFYGFVFPVRAMVAEARGFAGETLAEGHPLPTDELRAVGIYLRNLMSDVTDTRTTLDLSRRELKDAEKLASVGKLAASVAHEIRNPLTAIKMWLFSIQKEAGGAESLTRKFGVVSEEIRRLESIVRNFLEFSRPPELKLAAESVSTLLDKTLELAEPRIAAEKIRLWRDDAPGLPLILADREQLRQVLLNLLNNAAEAAGEQGRISVVTTEELDPQERKTVVVRVSDSGPGIPEEVSRRIFEPFFSTKEEGTGLGLCIAARIMARHEGRLVLESSNERGTTLAIHIPAAPAKQT